jgi:hypothetical protein
MAGERSNHESDPNTWKTVVRPQGSGYGKATVWEWTVYPEKDSVVPLLRGTVKGARQKALDAALAAVIKVLDKRARAFKKKQKKTT